MSRNKIKFTTAVVSGALLLAGMSACNRDQSTASLLAEARQYQQKGDQKAALIQLKNAVAKSPEDAEARVQLGALYLETGDTVSAEKELRKAASLGLPRRAACRCWARHCWPRANSRKCWPRSSRNWPPSRRR
jgi:Tfp pilus assembly protein PilF